MSPKYALAPPKFSNPRNNHDDQKIKYKTRKDAEKVMRRMIRQGCNGWERLIVSSSRSASRLLLAPAIYIPSTFLIRGESWILLARNTSFG